MNKRIVELLSQYDFKFEKNSAYGHIEGYEVNVLLNTMGIGPIFIFSTHLSQEQKSDFVAKMNARKISLVQVQPSMFGLEIVIGSATLGSFVKKFPNVLAAILEELAAVKAPKADICPQSGELMNEENSRIVTIPDSPVHVRLSNAGIESLNSTITKNNEDFEKAPNNYLKGFGGIFIGGVAGVVATIIFALLGYVSIFSSLISIFLGTFLYKKFGGKENAMMIIMSFVTTILMILLTLLLVYISAANNIVDNAMKGFEALAYCIKNDVAFKAEFIMDLSINAVFAILGEVYSIFSLVKKIKRPKSIQ